MKRGFLLVVFMCFLLAFSHLVISADLNVSDDDSDEAKLNNAIDCVKDKIRDNCEDLGYEDQLFSLFVSSECRNEFLDNSDDEECWPKSGCSIKTTAQAILALDSIGVNTDDPEEWLLDQEGIPKQLTWYLQIESSEATNCEIEVGSSEYDVSIGADKKLSSGAGSCLTLSEGSWWLRVSPNCYDEEFEITCDESFLTTLLYKKEGSSTIHVSETTNVASAEGKTTEQVESACFEDGNSCDYEGTLWAALVLNYLDENVSAYLPYLTTMKDDNPEFIPETFLYALTGSSEFRNSVLLKQKENFWDESGDKFYDTSVALYPFLYEEPNEKENAQEWLFDIQDDNGCWRGSVKDTSFILHSVFGKKTTGTTITDEDDCETDGFYCMSAVDCSGNILTSYSCSGFAKCCDTPKVLETCSEQNGDICSSEQRCAAGTTVDAQDIEIGEVCCVGGTCELPLETEDCQGSCRTQCFSDEEELDGEYSCNYNSVCCITKMSDDKSYFWFWIFFILIVLVVLAIIFREKLHPYYLKAKNYFDGLIKKNSKQTPPDNSQVRGMPGRGYPMNRPPQRKILPPLKRNYPPQRPPVNPARSDDMDEVLKKLKEMGK